MDDLIPFLIVIAISIIGAATRKKKKRVFDEDISDTQRIQPKDDFLSWMEKLTEVESPVPEPYQQTVPEVAEVQEEEEVPIVKYENLAQRKEQYSSHVSFAQEQNKDSNMQRVFERSKHESDFSKTIKETEISEEKQKVSFDLRKAVIYTEILNRKYT